MSNTEAKLSELMQIDAHLTTLLGTLLDRSYKEEEHYCGAISICIRYVIMLYQFSYDLIRQQSSLCPTRLHSRPKVARTGQHGAKVYGDTQRHYKDDN